MQEIRTIEGVFDGEKMWGDDNKTYPVPANYASKSHMVEGDRLKLTIDPDGGMFFKQIGPVHRRKLMGVYEGNYLVKAADKEFKVLRASVTFFKAVPGDECLVVVPELGNPTWAALESVIKGEEVIDKEL